MQRLLRVFSFLFHPLLIPSYATLLYFAATHNFFYKHEIYLIFIQVLILTILLPISLFYLLRSFGLLKSRLVNQKERRLPLAIYAILLLILLRHSLGLLVVPELYYYFLGCLISVIAALALAIANIKPSLHVMGICTLAMLPVGLSAYYHIQFLGLIIFLILTVGTVATARLMAGKHSLVEVALGALLGILPQVVLWFIWLVPTL
ncbi:MAG: hypothetical protein ACO1N9_12995 [Flavobacterium sp.]